MAATTGWFNLWERDLTIHVRNMNNENPENTPFRVLNNNTIINSWNTDKKKWEIYRGEYTVNDITKVDNWEVNLTFWNLHCDVNMILSINTNNYYDKNLFIRYEYDNNNLSCKVEVEPKSFERSFKTSIVQKEKPIITISLNDIYVWHYLSAFIFWLFLIIYLFIKYIDKKWYLISKKK